MPLSLDFSLVKTRQVLFARRIVKGNLLDGVHLAFLGGGREGGFLRAGFGEHFGYLVVYQNDGPLSFVLEGLSVKTALYVYVGVVVVRRC